MIKRLILTLAFALGIASPVFAAGTLPGISMTQQLDNLGKPLSGGKLYLVQAGTVATPQNCYQDSGLSIAWPNPITLDAAGRIPQLFCADGSIKIRLTSSVGVTILVQDNLLVVGPSGGGGGGGSVDPTTVLGTGDFKDVYGAGVLSGFVRCNGRTIGSATSGASERANADTSALFVFLYNQDPNLVVSGGRGASAGADFAANKTLALPDCRGRVRAGLDDMGNSPANVLTSDYFGAGTILGKKGGVQSSQLFTSNLPPYTPSGSISSPVSTSVNRTGISYSSGGNQAWMTVPDGFANNLGPGPVSVISVSSTFTGTAQGGLSVPVRTVQPTIVITTYLKL